MTQYPVAGFQWLYLFWIQCTADIEFPFLHSSFETLYIQGQATEIVASMCC